MTKQNSVALIEADAVVVSMMRASSALAQAQTIQQTKKVLDVAHAAEIYAKRQHLGEEAMGIAASIKVEALRKLGEMLQVAPKAKARFHEGNKKEPSSNDAATLAELGLTKKESAVAQKLAALPEKDFEQVRLGNVTVSKAIAAVSQEKPQSTNPPEKPETTPPEVPEPEEEYTEMDAARDQIDGLQSLLAVANMGDVSDEDKTQAANLIAELRSEIKTLRATLRAVTQSRDTLMNELAQAKRQCLSQRREIDAIKKVSA